MKLKSAGRNKATTSGSLFNSIKVIFVLVALALSVTGVAPASGKALSQGQRLRIFEEVWEDINQSYYSEKFNGVDWNLVYRKYRPLVEAAQDDQDFYTILRRMVGELRDTHTRVHTPEERKYREQNRGITVGVKLYEIEGKPTVISVAPQSEAELAGIKPGMRVLAIDDIPVDKRIVQVRDQLGAMSSDRAMETTTYERLLRGDPGSTANLTVEAFDGHVFTAALKRRTIESPPQVTFKRFADGFGYIKITAWEPPVDTQFANALIQLHDAPGLIVDIRGNGGGEAGIVFKIASMFFKERLSLGKFITRNGRVSETFSYPRKEITYEGPVTILVDEVSASGSELFAGVMQEYGRARVIGRESCGCLLVIQTLKKLHGGGELTVSELDVQTPKGKRLEGDGVIPNRTVPLTRDDLMRGRDAVLETAMQALVATIETNKNEKGNPQNQLDRP